MLKFNFIKTDDGSTGLFNTEINDIYHSRNGAKTESYEKFIISSGIINFAINNSEVKILDICYGVGYNTKSAFHFLKNINPNLTIKIDAIENDINTVLISPFIKDEINDRELNYFIFKNLIEFYKIEINSFYEELLISKSNNFEFFNSLSAVFLENYRNLGYKLSSSDDKSSFLHNIYYQYVSNSMKNRLKSNKYKKCSFSCNIDDARKVLPKLDEAYDFIFLDAFTPEKDPVLWSIDFLKLVKNVMLTDSVLVTYSISAAFRSELLELGFCVGKILKDENQIGTIASFNKNKISNLLNNFDLEFLKSNAGIFYNDEKLNSYGDEILKRRKFDIKNSNRISTTKFLKSCK